MMWPAAELARLLGCRLPAGKLPPGWDPAQVTTDSRQARPGELFVALRGTDFRGAAFVAEVRRRGATAAVVAAADAPLAREAGLPLFVVDDALAALGRLGRDVRRQRGGRVVAVTGSNGKTTTKELLAAALRPIGPVHKTHGNFNNLVGVPKTLLAWPVQARCAVVEMGMNAPGEIAQLALLAAPNVGLVTCVAAAHLEGLGTVQNVARAKVELFAELATGAARVLNDDDAELGAAAAPYLKGGPVVRFGSAHRCDVQLVHAAPASFGPAQTPGIALQLRVAGRLLRGSLPLLGHHNALNAAGALAAAMALGVAPERALAAMAEVRLPGGRLRLLRLQSPRVQVLDDGYNANPGSMAAALRTVAELAREGGGRVLAALGEMRELGPTGPVLHAELGALAARSGVARLFALGSEAGAMADAARAAGGAADAFADVEPLVAALQAELRDGDWLLVKGSRGMRMERVLQALGLAANDGHAPT